MNLKIKIWKQIAPRSYEHAVWNRAIAIRKQYGAGWKANREFLRRTKKSMEILRDLKSRSS
jgi:hypothetical protein